MGACLDSEERVVGLPRDPARIDQVVNRQAWGAEVWDLHAWGAGCGAGWRICEYVMCVGEGQGWGRGAGSACMEEEGEGGKTRGAGWERGVPEAGEGGEQRCGTCSRAGCEAEVSECTCGGGRGESWGRGDRVL